MHKFLTVVRCEDGEDHWYHFNGFCYYISLHSSSGMKNWYEAQRFCQDQQGDLASIHSDDETDQLLKMAKLSPGGFKSVTIWNGLNSLDYYARFTWSDGTALNYINWHKNEPDNLYNQEKCGAFSSSNGFWADIHCQAKRYFSCKRHPIGYKPSTTKRPIIIPGSCKDGWSQFEYFCYKLFGKYDTKEPKSWHDAFAYCRSLGPSYDLVSINSKAESNFINVLIGFQVSGAWLGLNDRSTESRFYWTDNSETTYTNWAKNEPNNFQGNEDCVECVGRGYGYGLWNDRKCQEKIPFICQTYADPSKAKAIAHGGCNGKEDYTSFDGNCYKIVYNESKSVTWRDAQAACAQDGGNLASVRNLPELIFVKHLIRHDSHRPVWIGMKEIKKYVPWTWSDDWHVNFTNWGPAEPKRGTSEKPLCATMFKAGFWKTDDCQTQRAYICKISSELPPKASQKMNGICPESPTDHELIDIGGEHCYHLFRPVYKWYDANYLCKNIRMNLPSFHSQEEMDAMSHVFSMLPKDVWIGLVSAYDGIFYWIDGTPIDYTNWHNYHPVEAKSRCVEVDRRTLKWKSSDCERTLSVLCAVRKIPSNITASGPERLTSWTNNAGIIIGYVTLALLICFILAASIYVIFKKRPWRKHFKIYDDFTDRLTEEESSVCFNDVKEDD
ncbi:CLEC17A (predicted) [Pycnogonum litorale]